MAISKKVLKLAGNSPGPAAKGGGGSVKAKTGSPIGSKYIMVKTTNSTYAKKHQQQQPTRVSSPKKLTPDEAFRSRGYKKVAKIDEGAFGIVSKAVRWSDNSIVAVKEVDLSRKRVKRIQEMKRELYVLQKIKSISVVKYIEHFIVEQTLVIIMEFCAGGNLTSYLKDNSIDEDEAKELFRQMALAIKILHRKCIAHRDVKLNNFLLDSSKKIVKVADFGLSIVSFKNNDGYVMAKTYCGTEPYMAPEILKRNNLGIRSYNPIYADIWSLGICLFAMLTRTFPFKMHTSQQGLFKAQVTREWRFPRRLRKTLSEEIKDLVCHMLDPEPQRRITINGIVSHPWLNNNKLVLLSNADDDYELITQTKRTP